MKILTANFLTCAVKACKSSPDSFPLHFKDAELVKQDLAFNSDFLRNLLPRIDWAALRSTANELGFTSLPESKPEFPVDEHDKGQASAGEEPAGGDVSMTTAEDSEAQNKILKELHTMLLETQVQEGKLVCGNCGHEYVIKEGIANFLLPSHLGEAQIRDVHFKSTLTIISSVKSEKVSAALRKGQMAR